MNSVENDNSTCKCICQVCNGIRKRIDCIFQVLDVYQWMLDAYVVDFYRHDLWNALPSSWINVLKRVDLQELGKWVTNEVPCTRVWPLSLYALREVIASLEISRNWNSRTALQCERDHPRNLSNTGTSLDPSLSHPKLKKLFDKSVKLKKRHEIEVMAKIVADHSLKSDCDRVVDIGAGMGHLARALAYKYRLRVACVEQQPQLTQQARMLDQRFESLVRKQLPDFHVPRPRHLATRIESGSSSDAFIDRLAQEFDQDMSDSEESLQFGLIGLHPCGDLAVTLLKFYTENERVRFICVAGCCYMKLTFCNERAIEKDEQGYPLSNYLRSVKKPRFSYAALEVACHAIESHCLKLKAADYFDLKVHAYRAALETVLVRKDPSWCHGRLKNVKLSANATFVEYCQAATRDLPETNQPRVSELEDPTTSERLENWPRVVIFQTLRCMLAPLVESVVLLDRFLYLSEKNLHPQLRAVFDPLVSPRNFLLTSVKHN